METLMGRKELNKRVGIMTFPNSTSHGAVLQMYALSRAVEELGCQAEVINYFNSHMKGEKHKESRMTSGRWKGWVRLQARKLMHAEMYRKFRRFEENLRLYPRKSFSNQEKLKILNGRYSHVICGSDQVWNPNITNSDLNYFLRFCGEDTRRVAYAPSFGVDRLEAAFAEQVEAELRKFSALSVREAQGAAIVEQMLGVPVPTVVDPTFLVPVEHWRSLQKPCNIPEKGYVLYYSLRHSDALWRFCKELAAQKNLPIVVVGGNPLKKLRAGKNGIQYAMDTGPREWLYLVDHASWVVTNSFHGVAFSINFRKNFFVEFSSRTNSRLQHIITVLGLSDRRIREGACENWEEADYSVTDAVLPKFREESRNYLEKALMEE